MNSDFKNHIETLGKAKMQKDRKHEIFMRLSAYADAHPIALEKRTSWLNSLFYRPYGYAIAATLLLALGSVSYAAEGSLPGDALYAIKIRVNEPIRGAAAITSEAKAEWELVKFERRLVEAEKLAADKKLDDASLDLVEKRIDKHYEEHEEWNERAKAQEVESRKAPAAAATTTPELKSSKALEAIEEHKAILEKIKVDGDEQNEKIQRLERKLEEKSEKERKKAGKALQTETIKAEVETNAESVDKISPDDVLKDREKGKKDRP